MKKKTKILWLVLVAILVTVVVSQYPKLNLISGFAAKNMASTVFLSNRTQESVQQIDHDVPQIFPPSMAFPLTTRTLSVVDVEV